ncbi:uncharacterized protein [Nicotiana tomentosiformis]|uniref:uncharacterized protein n=1 Tax=Nicotiana tomentosiformis TaxID=4098 RepID=UPI00388C4FE7
MRGTQSCLGNDVAMRAPSGDEEVPAPKQAKEKKRKEASSSPASVLHHEAFLRIREEHKAEVRNLTEKSDTYKLLSEKLQADLVNAIEAEAEKFKKNMDILASKKEIVQAQLESVEAQLQAVKEMASVQVEKIKELQCRLDLTVSDKASLPDELEVARSEVAVARSEVVVANKRADAKEAKFRVNVEVNHAKAKGMAEHTKWQARREAFEGVQA